MDIQEFEKLTKPKGKRSRLEPFLLPIFELKQKGYANSQISQWLAANGLKVSQESVRKFIKNKESLQSQSKVILGNENDASIFNNLSGQNMKQRRERLADQFITPENTNPLLKRFKEQLK